MDASKDRRSDEELVAAANRGDEGALGALYLRYRDWAVGVAYRFTGDWAAAGDVAQEAFVWLLGKFPGFVLRARLTTVLYPAIRNTALAARRKRKAAVVGEEELEMFAGGAPIVAAPTIGGTTGALAAAVARLPGGQREVLIMRVVDGMAMAEIAAALGIPEGTVKSRLHHALAAMRADPALVGYFGEGGGR